MKAGNCKMWRPFVGVTVISALAIAVTVQGGPRDGSLRTERGAKAGTSRLLSGSTDSIRAGVVAGSAGLTAVVQLTPKLDHPDGQYVVNGFYTNADISGQRLTLSGGGGRTFWNAEVHSWGTARRLRSYEVRPDSMSQLGVNADCGTGPGSCPGAGDLTRASQACAGTADCIAALGERAPACGAAIPGICVAGWVNTDRSDWVMAGEFFDTQSGCGVLGAAGINCFGAFENIPDSKVDDGGVFYMATYVLDIPTDAKGLYTLAWVDPDVSTTLGDDSTPQEDILLAAAVPGELNIPVGSCCTKLGLSTADCVDGLTQGECEVSANAPFLWSAGADCIDGCVECADKDQSVADGQCRERPDDLCTVNTCNRVAGICISTPIADWDAGAGQCCEADSGDVCSPSDANVCSVASCSDAGNRGTCIQTPVGAGNACNGDGDDNPCTFDDVCAADESCSGTDVNAAAIECSTTQDCLDATGLSAPVCASGLCDCSLIPDLNMAIGASGKANDLCFSAGSKITATVSVAAATAPVNGGQFLINYDPSCMSFNSVAGVAPYTKAVFGPVVDEAAGTIFVVVGVGFGTGNGPAGNAAMLSLSFTKMGINACDSCNLCFDSNNPMNTFLVDDVGQRIVVNPICSDDVTANNEVEITVPPSIKTNVDCGQKTAVESWDAPTLADACGTATLECLMQHQSQLSASPALLTGGTFVVGATNFCCAVMSDTCGSVAGSPGSPASAASDTGGEGCWTVEVNDQTSLDITIGLSPSTSGPTADSLTRCIKFTLYESTLTAPQSFTADVEFGAESIVGKSKDALKIPGHGNWDCITAWDQLHTLRSCFLFGAGDCVDGGLSASFRGDPAFGGNWLIGGNLDGWKKNDPSARPNPFVIDVLDFGTFLGQFGVDFGTGDTPCGTAGPHSDIDGDGLVTTDDYAFISMNFLASAKNCCGVDGLPAGALGVTEITIEELRRQGRGDLAIADLNGDGLLNVDDMNAFMQGARASTKSGSLRKGTR